MCGMRGMKEGGLSGKAEGLQGDDGRGLQGPSRGGVVVSGCGSDSWVVRALSSGGTCRLVVDGW